MSEAFNRWAMRVEPVITRVKTGAAVVLRKSAIVVAALGLVYGVVGAVAYGVAYGVGLPFLSVFAAIVVLDALRAGVQPMPSEIDALAITVIDMVAKLWAFFYLVSLFVPKGAA